ncbi:MAG: peptide ABC transporter substrate-binding protein [Anaerolineae bacterium]|nr:peptide ABC transporter substrate-binding protein [Anaerolineae bacterium]
MARIRVQVAIALLAIVLLVAAMGYLAFTVTTVSAPDYGGTYVEGIAGNPHTINPVLCQTNPVDQDLVALVFDGLTSANERGEIVPALAERWEISPDGTSYTFFLRQDVVWHDGAPFTAEDVMYTVGAMQHPDFQGVPFLADMWRTVAVELIDTYTIRFSLREPLAPFLDYTTIGMLPAHILSGASVEAMAESKFNAAPIGTGPFVVDDVTARRIVLVANASYYRPRPYLDRIEFIFYPDHPSVYEARRRGEIEGIARALPEHLQAIREDETLTLYSAPLSGYNIIFLNLDRGIFQDRAVRQGIMWALDRQALVDEILDGQGVVLHSPILPNSWAYDPDVPKYERNVRKARQALEEADWFDDDNDGVRERGDLRLEFTLATNEDDPVRAELIQEVSAQLAEVGIRAIPETVSWEKLISEQLRLRRFDAVLSSWSNLPPDPDPYPYWHSSQANEDGLNFASYISPSSDALLEEARATHDQARRVDLYRQFQHAFANEVPSVLLYQPIYNYAIDAGVYNVQIGPMIDSSDRFRTISGWYMATQRMLYSEAREKGLSVEPARP